MIVSWMLFRMVISTHGGGSGLGAGSGVESIDEGMYEFFTSPTDVATYQPPIICRWNARVLSSLWIEEVEGDATGMYGILFHHIHVIIINYACDYIIVCVRGYVWFI